jgi:hypothetical protein
MDKRFLIVACPRCRVVQVVDGRNRTRTCAGCSKRFEVGHLAVLGSGKDAREARQVVAAIKARQMPVSDQR